MKEKHFCRVCKGARNHKELFRKKIRGGDDDGYIQWIEEYIVIECLGCETISFLKIFGDSTMIKDDGEGDIEYYSENTIFPYYLDNGNELPHLHLLPVNIRDIYEETISAFKSKSRILTAGGLRAIIEAICNHLKIKRNNLEEGIDSLHKKGHLTLVESKRLHSIRFLGNDALHEIEKPKKEQLYILLDIVNHLLANLFINDRIMKGKMDVVIDKYDDFLKLVQNKITKDMLGQEFSLPQILGKSKRLINKQIYSDFEKQLNSEIQQGKVDFVSIMNLSDGITYKVIKEIYSHFDW